jgi:hypothetical protein
MCFHVKEAVLLGNIIHNYATVCISQVLVGNGFVPFLASRIPNLKFNDATVDLECFYLEVNTNRTRIILKDVIRIPQKHARFANFRVPN